jgi:hypothetical protein
MGKGEGGPEQILPLPKGARAGKGLLGGGSVLKRKKKVRQSGARQKTKNKKNKEK